MPISRARRVIRGSRQLNRVSRRSRAQMQKVLEKMAADKSLIDHLRGLKIKMIPNPRIPQGEPNIRMSFSDYKTFKADKNEGIKSLRLMEKLEDSWEGGFPHTSNVAVLFDVCRWVSKGLTLKNVKAEKGKDIAIADGLDFWFGIEEERRIEWMNPLVAKWKKISSNLDTIEGFLKAQKKYQKGKGKVKEGEEEEKEGDVKRDNVVDQEGKGEEKGAVVDGEGGLVKKTGKKDDDDNGDGGDRNREGGDGGDGNGEDGLGMKDGGIHDIEPDVQLLDLDVPDFSD